LPPRIGLARYRLELLDEDQPIAAKSIAAYQDLLTGKSDAITLLEQDEAIEKLGVTEGTLVDR